MRLSAIVITFNEQHNIATCLKSLTFCDEIIVLDSGSTDRTLEIASRFTDRIFIEQWKGFGPQKQSALQKATGEWVLSIDADEVVPEELAMEIQKAIQNPSVHGYLIPRKNLYRNKWLKHGGLYPDFVLRLFRKNHGRFTPSVVHERVVVEGRVEKLNKPLIHHAFNDLTGMIDKLNKYSSLSAEQMYLNGRHANRLSPFIHSLSLFIKDYILRAGFLDGMEGFNIAILKALGTYFKYQKLLEKQQMDKANKEGL